MALRTIRRTALPLAILSTVLACAQAQSGSIDATFYGTRGDSLELIFDEEGGRLVGAPERTVVLGRPSEGTNPWTAFVQGGFYTILDEEENPENNAVEYGSVSYRTVDLPDGSRITLMVFSRGGAGESFLGSDSDGRVWRVSEDEASAVCDLEYRTIVLPDGVERTQRMFRYGDGPWRTIAGDRLYVEGPSGGLEQVGWLEWRRIVGEEGTPMAIIMTKGMDPGARWTGRHGGVRYVDPR